MMTTSGNWSGPPEPLSSDDEDNGGGSGSSSDLEMGLDTLPQFDTLEDVTAAIDACKRAVLETEETSDSRKELVNKLIRLRIFYHDLQERLETPVPAAGYETRAHAFVSLEDGVKIPGVTNTKKLYCQQCCSGIWVYLQASQHCRECGFSVHVNCMDNIMRECVAQKVKTQPDFIMDICPEKTLPALKYRCVECDKKLSWNDPSREPLLCDYTGLYFCPSCHWNAQAITPARVIHNWDFEPKPVSQAAKQYLFLMYRKPVINVTKLNPKLPCFVQDISHVHMLREKVMLLKKYLVVCRIAMEKKLLLHLSDRQHFVDNALFYSLKDLVDVKSGALITYLEGKTALLADHVKKCVLCTAKGFICEICDKDAEAGGGGDNSSSSSREDSALKSVSGNRATDILFPFDECSKVCSKCQGVFHKECLRDTAECPKCMRRKKRRKDSLKAQTSESD